MKAANAVQALKAVCDAVIGTVASSGSLGTPGGTLYAALMAQGCSLQQFEQLMSVLVSAGKLEKRGELYFAKEAK